MDFDQLQYTIGLTQMEGIGNILAKRLISYCGSAEAVFKEKKSALAEIPGIGIYGANNVFNSKHVLERAEEEVKFIDRYKINAYTYYDERYPQRLKYCEDGPVVVFCKGAMDLNAQRMVSIVGTRHPTEYGKNLCEKLVDDLLAFDVCVVSGMAYGIDIIAHRTCVKNDMATIGVLAHGLDRIYPGSHKSTAEKMLKQGGLLTEFLSFTNPDRENFPKRNRIVAGMTDATIVIETGVKGGSMITANLANDYNRDVFAFPGQVHHEFSKGCNFLIRTNRAALMEGAEDLVKMMGWENTGKEKTAGVQQQLFIELDEDEKPIVEKLREKGHLQIDVLALETQLPVSKISIALLNLEFKGVVRSLPGKVYALS